MERQNKHRSLPAREGARHEQTQAAQDRLDAQMAADAAQMRLVDYARTLRRLCWVVADEANLSDSDRGLLELQADMALEDLFRLATRPGQARWRRAMQRFGSRWALKGIAKDLRRFLRSRNWEPWKVNSPERQEIAALDLRNADKIIDWSTAISFESQPFRGELNDREWGQAMAEASATGPLLMAQAALILAEECLALMKVSR